MPIQGQKYAQSAEFKDLSPFISFKSSILHDLVIFMY